MLGAAPAKQPQQGGGDCLLAGTDDAAAVSSVRSATRRDEKKSMITNTNGTRRAKGDDNDDDVYHHITTCHKHHYDNDNDDGSNNDSSNSTTPYVSISPARSTSSILAVVPRRIVSACLPPFQIASNLCYSVSSILSETFRNKATGADLQSLPQLLFASAYRTQTKRLPSRSSPPHGDALLREVPNDSNQHHHHRDSFFISRVAAAAAGSHQALAAAAAVVLLSTVLVVGVGAASVHYYNYFQAAAVRPVVRAAFVGNSITFVNDLPRFMEALSGHTIQQNSCLHGSLNLRTILTKGNGMYNKWQTTNAILDTISVPNTDSAAATAAENNDDATAAVTTQSSTATATVQTQTIYDFGACSLPQLLFGYDEALSEYNQNGYYANDGMNPCFQDANYLQYLKDHPPTTSWDFVILNDQTVYPGIVSTRKKSLNTLKNKYANVFVQLSAVPVFLSTYGYDKSLYDDDDTDDDSDSDDDNAAAAADESNVDNTNTNNNSNNNDIYDVLGDIPEFTSRVWYGYQLYAEKLASLLPETQKPLVVPSALAFLTVYEEKYSAWLQLFYDDGFHPSPHGTYLLGCCLYATLYQRMPPYKTFHLTKSIRQLFRQARMMHTDSMGEDRPYPTAAEAAYLASIAERVVLQGHVPSSLLSSETVAQMEADEAAASSGR